MTSVENHRRYFDYVNINDTAQEIHERNVRYGFKDGVTPRTPELIGMLILTEVAEAFEEIRAGHAIGEVYFNCPGTVDVGGYAPHKLAFGHAVFDSGNGVLAMCGQCHVPVKPEGFPIELADTLIRVLDSAAEIGVNIQNLSEMKMAYNDTRPPKHGKAS